MSHIDYGLIKLLNHPLPFKADHGFTMWILIDDCKTNYFSCRTGIAYISNVAVRENFRRKGIAKKLIAKAECHARSWGCRAIALHCDLNNPVATMLYKGQGYKCIMVPEGANWPQPRTSPDIRFNFMMKLLKNSLGRK